MAAVVRNGEVSSAGERKRRKEMKLKTESKPKRERKLGLKALGPI